MSGTTIDTNPRLAPRMAVIAFLHQNITFGCLWGSFSVLLAANEARFGVGRALSTLAVPAIMLATALMSPVMGALATRLSLRVIMLLGALFTSAGYALLAVAPSYPVYMIAFGLLIGPGFASAVVLPPTLVLRWFRVNGGRILGFVSAPIVIVVVPLIVTWAFHGFGLAATYLVLAGLALVAALPCLLIVDQPPQSAVSSLAEPAADDPLPGAAPPITMMQLLGTFRFWGVIVPAVASITGSVILTAHMVPIFRSWGLSLALAATLLSLQAFVGIFGTIFFGWLSDRIGGARTMLVLVVDGAALWLLLLLQPPFVLAVPLVGLIGFHGAGAVPVLGVMLGKAFGRENFSQAYGLMNLVQLPVSVLCVPAAALVFARTGSYAGAIIGEVAFLALGAVLLLGMRRETVPAAPIAPQFDGQ